MVGKCETNNQHIAIDNQPVVMEESYRSVWIELIVAKTEN